MRWDILLRNKITELALTPPPCWPDHVFPCVRADVSLLILADENKMFVSHRNLGLIVILSVSDGQVRLASFLRVYVVQTRRIHMHESNGALTRSTLDQYIKLRFDHDNQSYRKYRQL